MTDGAQVYEKMPNHVEKPFFLLLVEIRSCRVEYPSGKDKDLQTEIGIANKHRQYEDDRPTHHKVDRKGQLGDRLPGDGFIQNAEYHHAPLE